MADYFTVAKVGDIEEGQGQAFNVNGRMVAVFNTPEGYQAIDDFCPHMGASLAAGSCQEGLVVCPWHAWAFQLCDGAWLDNPKIKVDCFEVRVEGDEIQVLVPPRET